MGNVYLLTGEPRVGKTSIVKRLVERVGKERCGGFYTEEIRVQGSRVGFQLVTIGGQSDVFAHVDSNSSLRFGRYGVNLHCLETLGINALDQALTTKSLLVIDEIGPLQLASQRFVYRVKEMMQQPRPLVATIALQSASWLTEFEHHCHVSLYHLSVDNHTTVLMALLQALQQEI